MIRMEIRCCCTPGKLLGSVPVPDATKAGDRIPFPVMKLGRAHDRDAFKNATLPQVIPRIELEVAVIGSLDAWHRPVRQLALKSGELPLEVLSRIPGFIPAELPPLSSLATKDPAP